MFDFADLAILKALAAAVAVGCLALILSSRVRTGILPTLGLALIAASCFCVFDPWASGERALKLLFWGILAVSGGVFWHHGIKPWWLKLSMHWEPAYFVARHLGFERREQRR